MISELLKSADNIFAWYTYRIDESPVHLLELCERVIRSALP
jgi:hypothetical protein